MTRRIVPAAFAVALVSSAVLSADDATAGAAVGCLVAAALAHLWLTTRADSGGSCRWTSALMAGGAVAAAAVWLTGPPPFSDDVYRYLLDGAHGSDGVNPFAYAPESPKTSDLLASLPGTPNHGHLRTIYPPFAQSLFALNGVLGGTLLGWRAMMVLAALVGATLAERVRPRAGRVSTAVAVATHPLVVVSAAGNGNVDVVALPLVAGCLLAASRARPGVASAALGVAAGVKLFPVVLPAALAGRFGVRRAALGVAVAAVVLATSYAPLLGIGAKVTGSLGRYVEAWEFNSVVAPAAARAVDAVLGWSGVPEQVADPLERSDGAVVYYDGRPSADRWVDRRQVASRVVRVAATVLLLGVGVACWRTRSEVAPSLVALLLAFLLASPVVHPWYLLWLLVPALVSRSRVGVTWCATVTVAFWAAAAQRVTGTWSLPGAVLVAEYAPVAVAAAAALAALARGRAVPDAAERRSLV